MGDDRPEGVIFNEETGEWDEEESPPDDEMYDEAGMDAGDEVPEMGEDNWPLDDESIPDGAAFALYEEMHGGMPYEAGPAADGIIAQVDEILEGGCGEMSVEDINETDMSATMAVCAKCGAVVVYEEKVVETWGVTPGQTMEQIYALGSDPNIVRGRLMCSKRWWHRHGWRWVDTGDGPMVGRTRRNKER